MKSTPIAESISAIHSAQGEDAIVFSIGDEKDVVLDHRLGRQYLPKGATPVAVVSVHQARATIIYLGGTDPGYPHRGNLSSMNLEAYTRKLVSELLIHAPAKALEATLWLQSRLYHQITKSELDDLWYSQVIELQQRLESEVGDGIGTLIDPESWHGLAYELSLTFTRIVYWSRTGRRVVLYWRPNWRQESRR